MFFKKLTVPQSNETEQVDALEVWSVRWYSRNGEFYTDVKEECEFFTSENTANEFAESLRAAFRLIRHSSKNQVNVTKSVAK